MRCEVYGVCEECVICDMYELCMACVICGIGMRCVWHEWYV